MNDDLQYCIQANIKGVKMTTPKRTSLAISAERKLKIERLAVDLSYKIGKSVSWTELATYILDNYAKDAVQDIIHSDKKIK